MRELVRQIAAALDDDDCWKFDEYTATHKRGDFTLWIATGGVYLYRPTEVRFGFFDRRYLRRKVNEARERLLTAHIIGRRLS